MRSYLQLLRCEIAKELTLLWSYRFQWIWELVSLVVFFFFLSQFPLMEGQERGALFFSYSFWFYSLLLIGDVGNRLASEMKSGTFQRLLAASLPLGWVLLCRLITSIFRALILFSALMLPIAFLFEISFSAGMIHRFFLVLLSLLPGLIGFSFLLGSLCLLVGEVAPFIQLFNNSLLFLSGGPIPLYKLPKGLMLFSKMLPTTQAFFLMEQKEHSLCSLLLLSFVYALLGSLSFFYASRSSRFLKASYR